MKYKRLLLVILFITCFVCPINIHSEEIPPYVFDADEIFTPSQITELNLKAHEISKEYHCTVQMVITNDSEINEYTIQEYAEDLYLSSDQFGYGNQKDGFLLVVNTVERCYWLLAYGPFGNTALTDYGKELLVESFIDDFSNDEWFEGFNHYLSTSESFLIQAKEGHPVDIEQKPKNPLIFVMIGSIVGLITAFITTEKKKSEMLTAVFATDANNYITRNFNIIFRDDRFLYTSTKRTKIESEKKSGGTTTNEKGFSGKGGKF